MIARLLLTVIVALSAIPAAAQGTMTAVPELETTRIQPLTATGCANIYTVEFGDRLYRRYGPAWERLLDTNPGLTARVSVNETGTIAMIYPGDTLCIPPGLTAEDVITSVERPTNFVADPTTGGPEFVPGGVNTSAEVRDQMREVALRDYNRTNGQSTFRPSDFEIVGNIERGTLRGPGIVYFNGQPRARATVYRGERAFRATVRNLRTNTERQQIFLQACGNDARAGDSLQAAGTGFSFVPDGQPIPGSPPAEPTTDTPNLWDTFNSDNVFWGVVGAVLLTLLGYSIGSRHALEATMAKVSAMAPVVPVAAAVTPAPTATPVVTTPVVKKITSRKLRGGGIAIMADGQPLVVVQIPTPKRTRKKAPLTFTPATEKTGT